MRREMWAIGAMVVLLLSTSLAGCAGRSSTDPCWPGLLTVSPTIAHPGEAIEVSAKPVTCSIAFTDDRWYRLELQYPRWDVVSAKRVRVAEDGSFRTSMRVPDGAPPGQPGVIVTHGYDATCNDGGSCAGVTGQVQVTRPDFSAPDVRALQARLNSEQTQEGRLSDLGTKRVCLVLDRPWTSDLDIDLPAGWRSSGKDVLDAKGNVVARSGDYVRITVDATRTHAQIPGCKQDRTIATVSAVRPISDPPATPPGGRLVVGTSARLAQPRSGAVERSGTLLSERHGDYLCLAIKTTGAPAQQIALPPGVTARPHRTLLDGDDIAIARPGDRVRALVARSAFQTPTGCDGSGEGLGVYRLAMNE